MSLRLLDLAEAWALEAKTKLNAALTYLDGLQASVTAEIAAAITALKAANNTFSGDNIFSGDVDFTGELDLTGATSPGTAAAETFAEGTFTPSITFGGGSTGITYTQQNGAYTRIGGVVLFDVNIALSSKGSSTGSLAITGLPLTVAATRPTSAYIDNMTAGIGDGFLMGEVISGGTTGRISKVSAGSRTTLTDADFTNTSVIRLAGHYRT